MSDHTPEFFKLNAKYQVAPGNDADSLMNDATCFLSTAIGILEPKMGEEIDDHDMWACLYMMQQAYAAYNAAHAMIPISARRAQSMAA